MAGPDSSLRPQVSEPEDFDVGVRVPSNGPVREPEVDYSWGAPPTTESDAINSIIEELEADLLSLVQDMAAGPIGRLREDAKTFFGELRREFLRHHRRLGVHTRPGQQPLALSDLVYGELAELADRWRSIVFARAGREGRSGWSPDSLVEAVERAVAAIPVTISAPFESSAYEPRDGDRPWRSFRRWLVRLRRRLIQGHGEPTRVVALQRLVAHHLLENLDEGLEGLAAELARADRYLASASESLFMEVSRGYETLLEQEAGEPLHDALAQLRDHVEQGLIFAEREIQTIAQDAARRTTAMLSRALRGIKAEAGVFCTFELPASDRDPSTLAPARHRRLRELVETSQEFQELSAATYAHIALKLETEAFVARISRAFDVEIKHLEQDVRGRTHVQLARVDAAIDEALSRLSSPVREPLDEDDIEARLRGCLEPVERVVREAIAAAHRLLEQLEAEQALSPLVDVLNREAEALTDRYRVPETPYAITDARFPPPPETAEVRFREIVIAFVEVDVGPRVVTATLAVASKVQALLALFEDLERVVTFDIEMMTADLDEVASRTRDMASKDHLREVVVSALARGREGLKSMLEASDGWPLELTRDIRQAMLSRIATLKERLASADVAKLRVDRRAAEAGRLFVKQVARIEEAVARGGRRARRVVWEAVGDERLATLRTALGMDGPEARDLSYVDFAAPQKPKNVPLFYRRLFTPQAYWAGDVSEGYRRSVRELVEVLEGHQGATLRTAAITAVDGVGRGAVLSAIGRELRALNVRRLALVKPTDREDLDDLLSDVAPGSLVIFSGLHWLIDPGPRGFAALRRLVERLTADAGRTAWLLDVNCLVFRYACAIAPLSEVVAQTVEMKPLTSEELQAAVEARHHLSGYDAAFLARDHEAKKSESPERSPQAKQAYFRALHGASGGLLLVALAQWIASIVHVSEESKRIVLGPPPESPRRALARLDEESLLVLYQVARQGWMSDDVLARILRLDKVAAEARLTRLVNLALLERQQSLYQVRFHLRGALHQVLAERGWI